MKSPSKVWFWEKWGICSSRPLTKKLVQDIISTASTFEIKLKEVRVNLSTPCCIKLLLHLEITHTATQHTSELAVREDWFIAIPKPLQFNVVKCVCMTSWINSIFSPFMLKVSICPRFKMRSGGSWFEMANWFRHFSVTWYSAYLFIETICWCLKSLIMYFWETEVVFWNGNSKDHTSAKICRAASFKARLVGNKSVTSQGR